MSPSVRSSSRADASGRPAEMEGNYDNSDFSDSCGVVDRRSSYASYFARVYIRDNDLSPYDS